MSAESLYAALANFSKVFPKTRPATTDQSANALNSALIKPSTRTPICRQHLRLPAHPQRIAEGGRRLQTGVVPSTKREPLVTVITVVYNGADTVAQCIESVVDQTYGNIEYIILDGGSSDGTVEMITGFEEQIDYFVSQPDDGIYDAMNKGLSLAFGDYILLLNSDDWYRHDAVASLVDTALETGADVVHADAVRIDARGRKVGAIEGPLHAGLYTSGSLVRHETMLIRREIYDRFGGYDDSYGIIADYVHAIALYDAECRFEYLPERLLYFRMTGVSNRDQERRYAERTRLFRTLFPFVDDDDIGRLVSGRLSNRDMLRLIEKYRGHSEIFVRSLAANIAASPSFRVADALFESFAGRIRNTRLSEWLRPARRWLYRRLPRP